MTTNAYNLNADILAQLTADAKKQANAYNRGEAAMVKLCDGLLTLARTIMEGMDLAHVDYRELTSGERDELVGAWKRATDAIYGDATGRAKSKIGTEKSRVKAMVERGVCPRVTLLETPITVVTIGDGDKPSAETTIEPRTVDRIADWNQLQTSKKDNVSTFRAAASTTFAKGEKGKPESGYKRNIKRASAAVKDKVHSVHPTLPGGSVSRDAAVPFNGVPTDAAGTASAAKVCDSILAALVATPKGAARESALKILKRALVELEQNAHAGASKGAPTQAEKQAVAVPF